MRRDTTKQACAVFLITTGTALAFIQVLTTADVANGTLIYIAQAFTLAGSLFGIDYYITKLRNGTDNH